MKNPFRQLIRQFFGLSTPEPASSALMVGAPMDAPEARREDQSDLLRRAMMAASAPEPTSSARESSAIIEQAPSPEEVQEARSEAEMIPENMGLEADTPAELESREPTVELATEIAPGDCGVEDLSERSSDDMQAASAEHFEESDPGATEESIAVALEEVSEEPVAAPTLEHDVPDLAAHEEADVQEPAIEMSADVPPTDDAPVEEAAPAEVVEVEEVMPATPAPTRKKAATKKAAPRTRKASSGKSKKKQVAADEVRPEDDVWVSDAVVWSLSGYWLSGEWSPPAGFDGSQRLEEFRELAAEGKLTIWGRSDDAGVWQPIEAAYWKSCTVEPASLVEGRENVVAEPKMPPKAKGKAKAARKYSALKVSKSQVEELWRAGAMH